MEMLDILGNTIGIRAMLEVSLPCPFPPAGLLATDGRPLPPSCNPLPLSVMHARRLPPLPLGEPTPPGVSSWRPPLAPPVIRPLGLSVILYNLDASTAVQRA